MSKTISISIALITVLSCTQVIPGHKKISSKTALHEPEQYFDFDSLPLNTKLSLILQHARQLEERLPQLQYPGQLSDRQLASNIRIFAQSALKGTPPCKQCIEVRQQNEQ